MQRCFTIYKADFDNNTINGEPWSKYAAGYMWGVTGIIYNPEDVTNKRHRHGRLLIMISSDV